VPRHAFPLWASGSLPHHYQSVHQWAYEAAGDQMSTFMFAENDATAYKYRGFGVADVGGGSSPVSVTMGAGYDSASRKSYGAGDWPVQGLALAATPGPPDSSGLWVVDFVHSAAPAGDHLQLVLIPRKVGNYGTSHTFTKYKYQGAVSTLASVGGTTTATVYLAQPVEYYAFVVSSPSASYGVEKENATCEVVSQVFELAAP